MADRISIPEPPADLKERIKASYDVIASTYNIWTASHNEVRLHFLNKLIALLPSRNDTPSSGLTALELGCGAGHPSTATLLSAGIAHLTGNDLSSTQLDLARANFPSETDSGRVTWVQGDMMSLSFSPASFDVIVALYSVIHLPREEQKVLMERVVGWLRPGGMFLVNFATEEIEGTAEEGWLGREEAWMYWSGWGRERTMEMVRGLEGVKVVVEEQSKGGRTDAEFLWVIGRKKRAVGE